jgi:hypothetical protein
MKTKDIHVGGTYCNKSGRVERRVLAVETINANSNRAADDPLLMDTRRYTGDTCVDQFEVIVAFMASGPGTRSGVWFVTLKAFAAWAYWEASCEQPQT